MKKLFTVFVMLCITVCASAITRCKVDVKKDIALVTSQISEVETRLSNLHSSELSAKKEYDKHPCDYTLEIYTHAVRLRKNTEDKLNSLKNKKAAYEKELERAPECVSVEKESTTKANSTNPVYGQSDYVAKIAIRENAEREANRHRNHR